MFCWFSILSNVNIELGWWLCGDNICCTNNYCKEWNSDTINVIVGWVWKPTWHCSAQKIDTGTRWDKLASQTNDIYKLWIHTRDPASMNKEELKEMRLPKSASSLPTHEYTYCILIKHHRPMQNRMKYWGPCFNVGMRFKLDGLCKVVKWWMWYLTSVILWLSMIWILSEVYRSFQLCQEVAWISDRAISVSPQQCDFCASGPSHVSDS